MNLNGITVYVVLENEGEYKRSFLQSPNMRLTSELQERFSKLEVGEIISISNREYETDYRVVDMYVRQRESQNDHDTFVLCVTRSSCVSIAFPPLGNGNNYIISPPIIPSK